MSVTVLTVVSDYVGATFSVATKAEHWVFCTTLTFVLLVLTCTRNLSSHHFSFSHLPISRTTVLKYVCKCVRVKHRRCGAHLTHHSWYSVETIGRTLENISDSILYVMFNSGINSTSKMWLGIVLLFYFLCSAFR